MRMMSTGFNNCQVIEAIQNLPPEVREIIYKHYLAIKLRERAVLGWDLVHDELVIQPFCLERERLVFIMLCIAYRHCCREGDCCLCYEQEGFFHEPTIPYHPLWDITLFKLCTDEWGVEEEGLDNMFSLLC